MMKMSSSSSSSSSSRMTRCDTWRWFHDTCVEIIIYKPIKICRCMLPCIKGIPKNPCNSGMLNE
jgi:hypothetical protein